MKFPEKVHGNTKRQGWLPPGGIVMLALVLASVQAPAQPSATPAAPGGGSLIAPELAQAHPVIAQYHWSKLPNHAGKPKYGGTLHLDLRNELTNWDPFTGNTGTLGWGSTDYVAQIFAILGISVPDFWVGTLLILYFSLVWGFLPPLGYVSLFDDPLLNLQQFFLPVLVLGLRLSATTARMVRANMLEVLRQDYVRTARAKGLREGVIVYRHALKNALIPVLTILGTQLSALLGGTVILETLFSLPGVGFLTFSSIGFRDYPQIQANVLFLSAVLVFLNVLVDMSYSWLDPRIRYQ
jgi:Binding-protein-dependent transport system inner membrane component